MKNKCLLQFVLVLLTLNTFAQEFQVLDSTKWLCQYNYEFWKDSASRNSLRNAQMMLQIGSRLSKFCSLPGYVGDSLVYLNKGSEPQTYINLASKSLSGIGSTSLIAQYNIYKNYPKKGVMFFKAYDDHKFFKLEQPMGMSWRLDNQKDTIILGYACQKAFTSYAGRDYIAWYSPHIPLNDGPYKFSGLPGLIMKISDTKNQHCFTVTSIKKVNYFQPITFAPHEYVTISAEEYIKIMRNKMVRLFGSVLDGTITIDNEEARAKSLHGLKGTNNFIEKF